MEDGAQQQQHHHHHRLLHPAQVPFHPAAAFSHSHTHIQAESPLLSALMTYHQSASPPAFSSPPCLQTHTRKSGDVPAAPVRRLRSCFLDLCHSTLKCLHTGPHERTDTDEKKDKVLSDQHSKTYKDFKDVSSCRNWFVFLITTFLSSAPETNGMLTSSLKSCTGWLVHD